MTDTMKTCTKCDQSKPASTDHFHKSKRGAMGLNPVCKVCANAHGVKWRTENRTQARSNSRRGYHNNKAKYWEAKKARLNSDPAFRAAHNARCWIAQFLSGKHKFSHSLGCTFEEFKTHVERLFQPGMTWENYGEWHLDHTVPLSVAHLQGPEAFERACHYSNLQPLWEADHKVKTANDMKLLKNIKNTLPVIDTHVD